MRASTQARSSDSVRVFLRHATRGWHDSVEQGFATLDLTTRAGLGAFLLAQAAAVLPLEDALDRAGIADRVPDWSARRRAAALRADLDTLGLAGPAAQPVGDVATPQHALGVLYVLEGSRLGGRMLARRVMQSPDATVRAAHRFLDHDLVQGWPRFLALLEVEIDGTAARAAARAGAEMAFALFGAGARRHHPAPDTAGIVKPTLVDFAHA